MPMLMAYCIVELFCRYSLVVCYRGILVLLRRLKTITVRTCFKVSSRTNHNI